MQRPNTDSAPNMPVTLPRKQLLIRCVVTSPVHTVTIRCYGTRKRYKCVPTFKSLKMARQVFLLSLKLQLEQLVWCDEVNEQYCDLYGSHANLVYLGDFTPCITSCLPLEMCTFLTECTQPKYSTSNSDIFPTSINRFVPVKWRLHVV
jgi:hypothetical protein